jgi:hypothetical protein
MAEAARLGFDRMVTGPERGTASRGASGGGQIVAATDLREALSLALAKD